MISILQEQIHTNIPMQINLLPNNSQPYSIINNPNNNISSESTNNNEYKFITKKRGRKNKFIDNDTKKQENQEKNVHGKFSNDNIKRKLKGLYNSYIIQLLNDLLKIRFNKYKIQFIKMNIRYTKDIGIEFNRNLLNQKIKDIIINTSNKYSNKNNNIECIKYIQNQNNTEEIMNVLNMTYQDLYINSYLKSNSYETDKKKYLIQMVKNI